MSTSLTDRYPGLHSFKDEPADRLLFQGRDDEIDLLFHRICATRLLILFGKSGVGKTSLLQAGVFEKLRETQHILPILVRFNTPHLSPLKRVKPVLEETSKQFGIDYTPGEGETLWEFFKTVMLWQNDVLMTPLLVLDQFEEVFTLRSSEERQAIALELGDLLRKTLPLAIKQKTEKPSLSEQMPDVRLVISIREDFVGALQELTTEIPGLFDDRVRLNPLSNAQAEQAIRQPAALVSNDNTQFTTPPFSYTDAALADMIEYLKGKSGVIESFQLQLVCRDIEQQVAKSPTKDPSPIEITRELLGGRKRLNNIVNNFYQQTLLQLPKHDRKHIQNLCEDGLINPEGFRLSLQENEILRQYQLDSVALARLVEARLLHKEARLESKFYELSHDSLARAIFENRPWKLTRKQKMYAWTGVACLLVFASFGYLQWDAKEQAYFAERKAITAQQQEQEARLAAERVLNFLIFDLRDRLQPIGRLDIAEAVQQQVNDYFERLDSQGQSNSILRQRAVAYNSESDRLVAQGKLGEALKRSQKSLALSKKLLALDPSNTRWQLDVAVSLHRIGDVLNGQGKIEAALKHYQEGLAIHQQLSAHDPSNTEWQRDVSLSLVRIGDVLNGQGKIEAALKHYQESLAIGQQLSAHDPSNTQWQRDVSLSLERIGDVLKGQGKIEAAREYYQNTLTIRQQLVTNDPSQIQSKIDLSESLYNLDRFSEAIEVINNLVKGSQQEEIGQQILAELYLRLAWYELFNRQPERAIAASEQGLAIHPSGGLEAMLHTNLAHGYLFTQQFEMAKTIYLRYQDNLITDGRIFKQAVLDDFKQFRQKGITHPDMEKVEALYR